MKGKFFHNSRRVVYLVYKVYLLAGKARTKKSYIIEFLLPHYFNMGGMKKLRI